MAPIAVSHPQRPSASPLLGRRVVLGPLESDAGFGGQLGEGGGEVRVERPKMSLGFRGLGGRSEGPPFPTCFGLVNPEV